VFQRTQDFPLGLRFHVLRSQPTIAFGIQNVAYYECSVYSQEMTSYLDNILLFWSLNSILYTKLFGGPSEVLWWAIGGSHSAFTRDQVFLDVTSYRWVTSA